MSSLVECEHPISPRNPEGTYTSDRPEATMVFGTPLPDVLMGSVAERSICWHLAVAKLIVAWLSNGESHWPASGKDPLALTVTHWVELRVTTWAPVVALTSWKVHVSWENTSIRWHARRSVASLFVWSRLSEIDRVLDREVSHIVHGLYCSLSLSWSQNDWIFQHDITLVGIELAAGWTR